MSCKMDRKCAQRRTVSVPMRILIVTAIVLIIPAVTARFSIRAETSSVAGDEERIPLGAGELSVELVSSPFDLLFLGQENVPLRFSVVNNSDANVFIQYAAPVFTATVYGDRMGDYSVSGPFNPNLVIASGAEHVFEFDVDVLPAALIRWPIRIDGAVLGIRLDNMETVSDSLAAVPHYWAVVPDGATALLSLFDTRETADRSDDSLLCEVYKEQFALGTHHYLNKGEVLSHMIMDDETTYRLVMQINTSTSWDWQTRFSEEGYIGISGWSRGFGTIDNNQFGVKQLLVTNNFVPDARLSPSDIVRGATIQMSPPVPWNPLTDPWGFGIVDWELTAEIGAIVSSGALGRIVDCQDGGDGWEMTEFCEPSRYYFFETWFMPDIEWVSGDTLDLFLHLDGATGESDIDGLHALFLVLDDDSLPPQFSEFSPDLVPSGMDFDITCRITDPSGVFDNLTGSEGQGVYLIWDVDGELEIDFNEIQMSHVGDDIYMTDIPVPGRAQGEEVIYRIGACDDDFDQNYNSDRTCGLSGTQKIQVLSDVYLLDVPGSLYPDEFYAGEEGVLLHIELSNETLYEVTLETSSSLLFSDSSSTVTAYLLNRTIIPPGAVNFPLSFGTVDIPAGFACPDTFLIEVDLNGSYNGGASLFDQKWIASPTNAIYVLEPRIFFTAQAVSDQTVNPGARLVELLRLEAIGEMPGEAVIDSLIVTNTTAGTSSPPLRDLDFERLYIYMGVVESSAYPSVDEMEPRLLGDGSSSQISDRIDDSEELILSRPFIEGDSLLATADLDGGSATFRMPSDHTISSGQRLYYYVLADVDSFLAHDGDSLDLAVLAAGSIYTTGDASASFDGMILDSEGLSPIDGFMTFQMTTEDSTPDTIFTAEDNQPVLAFVIPANGHSPDILNAVSLMHYGDERIIELVEHLSLWIDDGDGIFSVETDSVLGELVSTGDRYQLSGLSIPVVSPMRFFATADFVQGYSQEFYALFGIPRNGIEFASANDGPIDGNVQSPKMQLLERREIISVEALPLPSESVHPGRRDVGILSLEFSNNTLGPVFIDSIRVASDSSAFACDPAAMISLHLDNGDLILDPEGDLLLGQARLASWKAMFGGIALEIPADGTAILFASVDADSFLTIDGVLLSAEIESRDDLYMTFGSEVTEEQYELDAEFPLSSEGGSVIDGMLAHQVMLFDFGETTIIGQTNDILMLDLVIPGNACIGDILNQFSVINRGTAGIEHISGMHLWADDGNGLFEPQHDYYVSVMMPNPFSPGEYIASKLSMPISPGGDRFFVSIDLHDDLDSGASIIPGIPILGIRVDSGNDGPIDMELLSESRLIIPVPDRVTFFSSSIGNKRVYPGEKDVLNLALSAYNSYMAPKILQSVVLVNGGDADSLEIEQVELYEDANGNGLFEPELDRLAGIGRAEYIGPVYAYYFEGLNIALEDQKTSHMFVSYGMILDGLRDSVKVDFQVSNELSLQFMGSEVVVQGYFPLNSAGSDFTDGMIRAQIGIPPLRSARVAPGENDVPVLSLVLPCNGSVTDHLKSISFANSGTAQQGTDIGYVKLWREAGGDPLEFDPGLEEFIDFLAWNGDSWKNLSPLSETIPCSGLTIHVTADIAGTAGNGRTLRFVLPSNGAQVFSGNDGPLDGPVPSPSLVTVTTDALIVSLETSSFVTVGQEFDVEMRITNAADTFLTDVEPDSFSYLGDGMLSPVSGPDPPAIAALGGGDDSLFVWRFSAGGGGWLVFEGRAIELGGVEESLMATSDTLVVQLIPDGFGAELADLAPVSLNRGQDNIPLIELQLDYDPPTGLEAPVDLLGIRLLFTDGSGTTVPVESVASQIRLENETMVLCTIETAGISDSSIVLAPSEPYIFEPGTSSTFWISLSISETASADDFKLHISQIGDIQLSDHNSNEPVLVEGITAPWSTNAVQLQDPALSLIVEAVDILPDKINRGQDGIEGFELVLSNGGGPFSSSIDVSRITFHFYDGSGDSTGTDGLFRSLSVKDAFGYTYCTYGVFEPSSIFQCDLQPAVTVSPQIPVTLRLCFDCIADPVPQDFFVSLDDSLDIFARDDNSGSVVPVLSDTSSAQYFPLMTGVAEFMDPLENVSVIGEGIIPPNVIAGQQSVSALNIIISHVGTPEESSVLFDQLELKVLDEVGRRLIPYELFERAYLYSGALELASVSLSQVDSASILFEPDSGLVIDPGVTDTLVISFDIEPGAGTGYFQIHIDRNELLLSDATDGSEFDEVEGVFPLTSGMSNIVVPAESALFSARGLLPANVVSGESIHTFDLLFERESVSSGTAVLVESISFDLLGSDGSRLEPGRVVESAAISVGGLELPADITVGAEQLIIDLTEPIEVVDGGSIGATVAITIASDPTVDLFSVSIESSGDVVCSDEITGSPVSLLPADGFAFPFLSGRAVILAQSASESFSNYPNPFIASREDTRITFFMPSDGRVTLKVYTVTGHLVKTLLENEHRYEGLHQDVTWDGLNGRGNPVLNGVYLLVIETNIGGRQNAMKRKVSVLR